MITSHLRTVDLLMYQFGNESQVQITLGGRQWSDTHRFDVATSEDIRSSGRPEAPESPEPREQPGAPGNPADY
jgi:hypothetical protein